VNRSRVVDMLADTLARASHHPLGVAGLMIMSEIEAGRRCVQPGDAEPFDFPKNDWHFPAVVSLDGAEVRIIAILANEPGSGAFSRLIRNIRAAGLSPVVVEPVGLAMPAILKRWGWRGRRAGFGMDVTWEWRPMTNTSKERPAE
jgi:hypothetical protein